VQRIENILDRFCASDKFLLGLILLQVASSYRLKCFPDVVTLHDMSVTGVSPTFRDGVISQVERVVSSGGLKGSESLCKLLRYLAEHFVDNPGEPIKEYRIAVEVFGRSASFDPRLDATVRVQTGRLRSKLAEYYALEGSEDPLVLDIPKGSYSLAARPHVRAAAEPLSLKAAPATEIVPAPTPSARTPAVVWILSILCLGLLAAVIAIAVQRQSSQQLAPAGGAPPILANFWRGFVERPDLPLVVFSNAEFVGRPETGMRYFKGASDSGREILDHYTGVGEVLAIHELDRVFNLLNHGIRVKRGRLLTLDDAQTSSLIYLGSPAENLVLQEIPTTREFVFRRVAGGSRRGDLEIANLNPRDGEQRSFLGSRSVPITDDYALLALIAGRNAGRWMMILAGTTTIGTQAAVESVCRERDLQELVSRIGVPRGGRVPPFEAVLHIDVKGGVPVGSQVVAVHSRPTP
jgi:hypothetical protein